MQFHNYFYCLLKYGESVLPNVLASIYDKLKPNMIFPLALQNFSDSDFVHHGVIFTYEHNLGYKYKTG